MDRLEIYGSSDDLIEIEGAIREEFSHYFQNGDVLYLAISDGTLLEVRYEGCWRFTPLKRGTSEYAKEEAEGVDSDNYSDRITLKGEEFHWVALATEWAGKTKQKAKK